MKMLTRLLALAVALMMLCTAAFAEAEPVTEPEANPADVMLTVNGTDVTREQYERYLATMVNYYAGQVDTSSVEIMTILEFYALDTAVQYAVMDQKIVELGISLTEEERAAAESQALEQWESTIASGMTYYGITDASTEEERAAMLVQILAELEGQGYTEQTYIDEMVTYAGYDKLTNYICQNIIVTEAQIEAYYAELVAADEAVYANDAAYYEQVQQMNQLYAMYGMSDYVQPVYYLPHGYRAVTHILLTVDEALLTAYTDLQATYEEQQIAIEEGAEVTETLVTAEEVEAARLAVIASVQTTLDEINGKLAAGEKFNDLIPVYSTDPGMTTADAIAEGYNVHKDSINWDPVFTAAAYSVDTIGQVSEPVVGSYGVHLVCYDHDVEGGAMPLTEDMKMAFMQNLVAEEQNAIYAETMTAWIDAAEVVYSAEAQAKVDAFIAANEPVEESADETVEAPAAE